MALPSCATQPISRVRAARPHCAIVLHANSRWSDRTVAISLVPRRAPIRRAGKLAVMWRGGCSFVDKVRRAQSAGAVRDGPARSARLAWRCSRPLVLATSSRMARLNFCFTCRSTRCTACSLHCSSVLSVWPCHRWRGVLASHTPTSNTCQSSPLRCCMT